MNDKKQTNTLIFKIPMFILVVAYLSLFIYQLFTKDFNIDNNDDKLKLILVLISVFIMGITSITKSKISILFSLLNSLLIIYLFLNNFNIKIIDYKTKDKNPNKLTCNGKTETSDDTIIDIDYENDKITKIVYTYIFNSDTKDGAENLVNHFDKQYSETNSIYSEITIGDKIEVKFTYNINELDNETIKNIDNINTSYKKFKKEKLNNFECKNRD